MDSYIYTYILYAETSSTCAQYVYVCMSVYRLHMRVTVCSATECIHEGLYVHIHVSTYVCVCIYVCRYEYLLPVGLEPTTYGS